MDIGKTRSKPPTGRMKARAPPPPSAPQPAPRKVFTTPRNVVPDGGGPSGGEAKENMLQSTVDLHITLPGGFHTTGTMDGSKALMDLLVDLCSQHHLNPAYHTLELLSPQAQPLPFKPNVLLGTLDVHYVLIKEKVTEDKVVRKPPPKVPEKTVRLVVNYHRTQKAVVRVNPLVPLESLVPIICEKCDFQPSHVILLRDNVSNHEMDLDKSLNELGIRELYVLDQNLVLQPKMASAPALNYSESLRFNNLSTDSSEKKGLLGFFKFNKRKTKGTSTNSSIPCGEARPSTLGQSQSVMNIARMSPKTELKKRQAPPPPERRAPLSQAQSSYQVSSTSPDSNQQKKRRAPAPPPTPVPSTPAEDSMSELSRSSEDSDPRGSICSSSSLEAVEEDAALNTSSNETESALNLKLEEADNNRHSTIVSLSCSSASKGGVVSSSSSSSSLNSVNGAPVPLSAGRQVPLKPRRTPTREPPILVIPPPPPYTPPPTDQDSPDVQLESHMDVEPQSWLRSVQGCEADRTPEAEVETGSVGSSSSSFPDQGYAASEGTPSTEDSAFVSSPSDLTHPASPNGSVSLDGGPAHAHVLPKDCSSDSDEGCATWGSRRRQSHDIYQMGQEDRRQECYEEDTELTAQLNQTLADLEAGLTDVDHTEQASVSESVSSSEKSFHSGIPVSVLDFDVPVTTINEVLEDGMQSVTDDEEKLTRGTRNITSAGESMAPQPSHTENKNNNACTFNGLRRASSKSPQAAQPFNSPEKGHGSSGGNEKTTVIPVTEIQEVLWKRKSHIEAAAPTSLRVIPPVGNIPDICRKHPAVDQNEASKLAEESERSASITSPMAQSKITQNPTSRFGMKTFTVIPPKPAFSQKSDRSMVAGAIKIDEQGNMVIQNNNQNKYGSSPGSGSDTGVPLLEKAKAFWSSTEQHDTPVASSGNVMKIKGSEVARSTPAEPVHKSRPDEASKEVMEATKCSKVVESKLFILEPPAQFSKSIYEPPQKRDISFLRPSRRTSSQYVASAITKYAVKPTAKAASVKESNTISESPAPKQKLSSSLGFSNNNMSTNKESNNTMCTPASPDMLKTKTTGSSISMANPKRSMSFPVYATEKSDSDTEMKLDRSGTLSTLYGGESADSLDPSLHCRNDNFSNPEPPHQSFTSAKPAMSTTKPNASDGSVSTGPSSVAFQESNQGRVFGSVRKFKPVIPKPVQKDVSLHSSLMEAIQAGDGKERLRKISDTTRESTLKTISSINTENEHSALLAAIRAENNPTRLRKTKSEAANELDKLRNVEIKSSAQSNDIPPPPSFLPPPPPPAPPPSNKSRIPLNQGAARNPENAREAMLEAIRSGTGAERLKKVPVSTKTVLVNGRLGTIHSSSSVQH